MNESKINKRMLDVNAAILPDNIIPPPPSVMEKIAADAVKNIATDVAEKGDDATEKDTTVQIPTNVAGEVNDSTNAAGGAGKSTDVP